MKKIFEDPVIKAILELDNSPAMRAIRAMEDSPSLRIMRELDDSAVHRAKRQLESSPVMKAIREFEESPATRVLRELGDSPSLKYMSDLKESKAFKAIQILQDSPALRVLRTIENSAAMEAFSRIADQVTYGYGALTFAEAYELVAEEYEEITGSEPLDALSDKIQDRVGNAPSGSLSADFYISLLVAVILFYWSQLSSQESEERIIGRIGSLEKAISSQLAELNESKEGLVFLFSDRAMNLRSGPGTDHDVIGYIPRNQKLVEIERERDWTKVEYFDHINNLNVVGWAHSRYILTIADNFAN